MPSKAKRTGDEYMGLLLKSHKKPQNRILVGVPMTGLVRSEWAMARWGQTIPCNWSNSDVVYWYNQASPLGFAVAEARNLIVDAAVKQGFEWLFFIDHDVILPPTTFIKINQYIINGDIPVVSGLYCAKAHPPEPLLYRGRGNSYYTDWKLGDKVWVDGIPMGCALLSVKLLREMWNDAPWCVVDGNRIKQVFDTPSGQKFDPIRQVMDYYTGTEDLSWCTRVITGDYLKKSGFPKIAKKEFPFLMDTSIFCKHITTDGQEYPLSLPLRHKPDDKARPTARSKG